jgi:hypothetical protein
MLKTYVRILFFPFVILMCGSAATWAGPVMYASSDPETSSGTELYVIDPIAATITVVRGAGIGASGTGTYGGVYGGGGYAGGYGGGAGTAGYSGLTGGSGGAAGGIGPLGTSSTTSDATTSSSTDPLLVTNSTDIVPQQSMIVLTDTSQPDLMGAQGGSSSAPAPGCITDCGGTPPIINTSCTSDCGNGAGDPPAAGPQGSVQIAALPEPGPLALLGIGLASLGIARRRKAF